MKIPFIPFIPFPKGNLANSDCYFRLPSSVPSRCRCKWCALPVLQKGIRVTAPMIATTCIYLELAAARRCLQTVFNESSQLPSGGVTRNIPSLQMRKRRPREAGNLPLAPQLGCEAGRFNVSTAESLCSPPPCHTRCGQRQYRHSQLQGTGQITDQPTAFAAEKTDLMR